MRNQLRIKLIAFFLGLLASAPAFAQSSYTSLNTGLKNNLNITGKYMINGVSIGAVAGIENAISSKLMSMDIGPSGTLPNSTTYTTSATLGRAMKIINISASCATAPVGGTNTLTITKNGSTTLLSTANVDPTTFTSNTGKILTLTGTAATLTFAATDTINISYVSGVQTTAAVGPSVTVEVVPVSDY